MSSDKTRFFVCHGCTPDHLFHQVQEVAAHLKSQGGEVDIYSSVCLSACRFNNVVKVQQPDGTMVCYSSRNLNGFHKWEKDPVKQLIHNHVPDCELV